MSTARLTDEAQRYVDEVLEALGPAVASRLRGGVPTMSPRELARRMAAVAPAPAPANPMAEQVGPEYFDTAGVAVVLAGSGADPVSKQAIEQRRRRRTLLALPTSDRRWIYPTWQFRGRDVMPGLGELLAVFGEHAPWSVGTWLTTPREELDGLTAVQWLDAGRDREHLLRVARHAAARWAA